MSEMQLYIFSVDGKTTRNAEKKRNKRTFAEEKQHLAIPSILGSRWSGGCVITDIRLGVGIVGFWRELEL